MVIQQILHASKLLEGRISFETLIKLDIPTFDAIVDNEFANVDASYKAFRETGSVNAYTKNETPDPGTTFAKTLNENLRT